MEIIQKRFSNKAIFSFEPNELKYTIDSSGGKHSFSMPYGQIALDDMVVIEERNQWYRNVGMLWVGLGSVYAVATYLETGEYRGDIWLILGVILLFIHQFAVTEFRIIKTEQYAIRVIKNKQYDQVITELTNRRNAQWEEWYGAVNLHNEPAKELDKFRWLMSQDVISEAEYQTAKERISRYHGIQGVTTDNHVYH